MPRNGSGTFSLVNNTWYPPVNGVLATATDWTPFITDIQNALTQSIASDGQTPMTGNLPMGNNKITGLANGTAATDAAAYGQIPHAIGQCRLIKSGVNLVLQPYNGNQINIAGVLQVIPAAGVTLTPTGVAGTVYYVYAYMVGAVITLEISTTGHSTDITTGVEIKTGDSSRTLVGMCRVVTGPAFQDDTNHRFVISWFNRRPINTTAAFTATRSTASGTYVEINTEIRNEFLVWSGDMVQMGFDGSAENSALNGNTNTAIGLDGAASLLEAWSRFQAYANGAVGAVSCTGVFTPTEGYHFTTVVGAATVGTGAWSFLAAAAGNRCTLKGVIQG